MSVARSAYRHILSLAASAPQHVENLDDLCFALFGILLNRSDFVAAGYGNDLNTIARNCFLRPIILDDPRDSVSARLASSFVVLRKLHGIENSQAWQLARKRRKGLLVQPSGSISQTVDAHSDLGASFKTVSLSQKEEKKEGPDMGASQLLGAAVSTSHEAELEAVRRLTTASKAPDKPESISTVPKMPIEDDNIVVGDATIFIERPKAHRVQKCNRHVVICRDRVRIPPYSYLLPPEPMYHANIRHDFPFHLMNDAIICLAASSALLKDQITQREGYDVAAREKTALSSKKSPSPRSHGNTHSTGSRNPASSMGPEFGLPYDTLPRSLDELFRLLRSIPTRTVMRTDFVEVEVCTQYVCSDQPVLSAAAPLSSATRKAPADGGVSPPPSKNGDGGQSAQQQHLFLYYVFIRVLGPQSGANPRRWHAQVMSQHLVVMDPARGAVLEMVRPGVVGNFPMLAPGESHTFESGTSIFGTDGILRGTIQLNAFNEYGEMRALDVAMAPTRLSVSVKGMLSEKSPSNKESDGSSLKEVL